MMHPRRRERADAGTNAAAEVSIRIGGHAAVEARITSAGLLAIGALVSAILLSTAVVVRAAGRDHRGRVEPAGIAADGR